METVFDESLHNPQNFLKSLDQGVVATSSGPTDEEVAPSASEPHLLTPDHVSDSLHANPFSPDKGASCQEDVSIVQQDMRIVSRLWADAEDEDAPSNPPNQTVDQPPKPPFIDVLTKTQRRKLKKKKNRRTSNTRARTRPNKYLV